MPPNVPPTDALRAELDALIGHVDPAARRAHDPVAFVWRYTDPVDQEVVSVFAAALAYGRVTLIARGLEALTQRMGPTPGAACRGDDADAARARFDGFVYRLTRGVDVARLWAGLGALLRQHGTLGAAFAAGDPGGPTLRGAMAAFRAAIRVETPSFPDRRGFAHLLPDPQAGSAAKRLNLWLRWLVRGPDGVDLGLWPGLDPARLTMPVDTHVHRIGRYLGLTRRAQADWRTAEEITGALRRLDAADPLRYDFALAHLGISGACPTRRVPEVCVGCPIRRICRLDAHGRVPPG